MNWSKLWNYLTYIFRFFKKDRNPEYLKINEDNEEIIFNEYGKLSEFETNNYSFILNPT